MRVDSSIRRLYEDLRTVRVVVVHPPGEDRDTLVEQLRRIGCQLSLVWPFPSVPPVEADVILFHVAQELQGNSAWCSTEADATLVALADYESPTTLKLLLNTHAHGVLTKPLRSSGVLNTLALARSARTFQMVQQNKIRKLEDTIKGRRQIEKAIRMLMEHEQMGESQAYEHMRSRATALRMTVAEVAGMVVDARETLEKLGLNDNGRGQPRA
ncbi:Aliphatic amidase regulator [Pararobbsia alpina]|uniref:Aliphatic amidase regulator n=1 Tax=Pararobbsia alpina TaxID=621374 RepID=A0A6S7C2Y5_9BURK|nr:Aliphatic amidase regulator [Pararobbsia alpina]